MPGFVGFKITFEPFHQIHYLFGCRQLPILQAWIFLHIQKVCGKHGRLTKFCLCSFLEFGKVLALLRIKILCRFCVLVYKETCLFLVSYKPIHTDFQKGGRVDVHYALMGSGPSL